MNALPIVARHAADPPAAIRREVERMASALRVERADLVTADAFRPLQAEHLDPTAAPGPALHLDDLSEIPLLDVGIDVRFYQDRARLRAGDGDMVASCADPAPAYDRYCQDSLGIGAPRWLHPRLPRRPLRIAEACWEDGHVRAALIEGFAKGELQYIHPHMGTLGVWELASLLHEEARAPVRVLAPFPQVTRWVNNKLEFTNVVIRLFGDQYVPRTEWAANFAYLAKRVSELAQSAETLGIKVPNSGGGGGNLVVPAARYRGRPLPLIRELLKLHLRQLAWDGASPLLVDSWETGVLSSPSVQLWIPPPDSGEPIVEGVFQQLTEGLSCCFVGSMPAQLPSDLTQAIVDHSWLLARLFQLLGYVGRCSLDLILVGSSLQDCRMEFVECNGRWGGTSLPMSLLNRIFKKGQRPCYVARSTWNVPGLQRLTFPDVLDAFPGDVFDRSTGRGFLIFLNPGALRYRSGLTCLTLGTTWREAEQRAREMPARLQRLAEAGKDFRQV